VDFVRGCFPSVCVLENDTNVGFSAAINMGLGASNSPFVLLLNPDTSLSPQTIGLMLHHMRTHPKCGISGARLLNDDDSPQESVSLFPTPLRILRESLFPNKITRHRNTLEDPYEVDAVVGACLMARREMICDIGSLDESFFLYSEEVDWCLRARLYGWDIAHIPRATVRHGLSRSSAGAPGAAFVALYRSKSYYMQKHFSRSARLISHIGMFVGVVVRLLVWIGIRPFVSGTSMPAQKLKQNWAVFGWYLRPRTDPRLPVRESIQRWPRIRPHIAIVTSQPTDKRGDVRRKHSSVGTLYYMTQALEKHAGHVSFIRLPRPLRMRFGRIYHKLLKVLLGKSYDYEHFLSLSRYYGRDLSRQLQQRDVDVIYAPIASAEIAMLETEVPVLYHSDATVALLVDYYPEYSRLTSSSMRQAERIEQAAIDNSDALVYCTRWAAESAIESYGANDNQTHVVPYGANLDEIPRLETIENGGRTGDCRLVFVGVNWHRKGGDIAFDALLALADIGIEAHLTICGCTPPPGTRHPCLEVVPFLDKNDPTQRKQYGDLLLSSDFLILPTRADSFGIVFCEAAAYGLPVITADTGGISEVVRQGETGTLLPVDAKGVDYANAIAEIFEDEARYHAMSVKSRQVFDNTLNWDHWGQNMQSVIQSLVPCRKVG
ncbi:MAG: glycosyltransferase, partial [Candidatus Latescibacteria bacterium]|nr:glycosyltransferase [Candidatus Latescibacterota bacterium]